jgi:hypothetical protein
MYDIQSNAAKEPLDIFDTLEGTTDMAEFKIHSMLLSLKGGRI